MFNITSRLNSTRTLGSTVVLGIMLFLSVPAATYAADTIIDNPGPGTSWSSLPGWHGQSIPSAYKGQTLRTSNKTAWSTFKFGSLASGKYDVYMHWPNWSGTLPDNAAPVIIKHSSGTQTVTVNQRQNGGRWNHLGRWTLNNTAYLTLTNRGKGPIYSDAVKLVPTVASTPPPPPPPPPPASPPHPGDIISDNQDPGASWSSLPGWHGQSIPSAYKGQTLRTSNKTAWSTFKFGSLASGKYDVYMHWPNWSGTLPDNAAPVIIKHSSGTQTVTVNQQQNGGQWNRLGSWTLDNTAYLTLTNRGNGPIYSDAVKLVPSVGTPPQDPTLSLSANPVEIGTGGAATLSWASQHTTSCTANGGWSGNKGMSGMETVKNITSSQTYNLTCAGTTPTKNVSATVKVAVISTPPPPPVDGSLSGPGNCAEAEATSDVVFCQDFDGSPAGDYSVTELKSDFPGTVGYISGFTGATDGAPGPRAAIVSGSDALAGNAMRAKFPKNTIGSSSGAFFRAPIGANLTEAYIGYWVRFEPSFPDLKGGKLPGLTGGTTDAGQFAPCCGRPMLQGKGFSTRLMFVGGRRIGPYFYWMDNPNSPASNGSIFGYGGGHVTTWVPGQWYFIEEHVKLNSPAGAANGLFEVWVNGNKLVTIANTRIRGPGANFSISHIQFDTYLGGNTSSWYSPKDTYTFFDVMVVSRNRIGGPGGG